ncbi:uncharacterized protein LOC143019779 isoform X2 [Oratosquilla oratoria]|uniref:uncharacterized protein LOC143019779 isoform X2 n=1 Tax=Oratosquilla oratoria TaxID=337810 RepID=UPI003F7581F7
MKFVIVTLTLVVILGSACDATRSRRSVAGWFVDYFVEGLLDMALTGDEHTFAYTMYKSYRGHDECFERLLCELGIRLREFHGSTRMLSYIDNFVPPSYKNLIETLKQASQGTSCDDIGCGTIGLLAKETHVHDSLSG